MKPSLRIRMIPYLITALIAGLAAFGVYVSRGLTEESTQADRYRALSDSFAVPGMLLLAFGVLLWVVGEGALLGVSWVLKNAVSMLIPGKALTRVSYAEYRAEKMEHKTKTHACFFIVGGLFCIVAVVFVLLFNGAQ